MNQNYYVNRGKAETTGDTIKFKGELLSYTNPTTGEVERRVELGEILFPDVFREGTIQLRMSFDEVIPETRAGIILNYQNVNGVPSFYHIGIRNQLSTYCIDYFNGQTWEFKALGGQPGALKEKKEYSLKIELKGNILLLFIDGVRVLEYSGFINDFSGVCGVFACNGADTLVKNIDISTKKPTVFTIMKFEEDFDVLYNDVIKVQCEKMGFQAIRADEFYTSSAIIQDIIREICNAAIIIADITMDNANVFYELGYAHALQKPTILLADIEKRAQLPFDLSGFRTIFYANTIGGKKDVEQRLCKFIENIVSPSYG